MTELRSVAYVSTASRAMSIEELEDLQSEAIRLNTETGTTGILLYSDGNFMQCFEGVESTIELTYDRIRSSTKHRSLIELMNEPIEQRSFVGWYMALLRPPASEMLKLSSAQWHVTVNDRGTRPPLSLGFELLKTFWTNSRQ